MTTNSTLAFVRGEAEGEIASDIYRQPDPRSYFRLMFGLDYALPDIAAGVFRQLVAARARALGRRIKIVDLGCGYGTSAALMRYPVDMDDLAHRYRDLDLSDLDTERLVALDRHYFQAWPSKIDAEMVGFDLYADALAYAQDVALIDQAVCCDFNDGDLTDADRAALSGADLIVSTTAADFLSEASFGKLLDAIGGTPWAAIFAVRVSPMYSLQAAGTARGLETEKLKGTTFVQRRFASTNEWTQVLLALENQGIAATGKESEGLLHSEFFLMRPKSDQDAEAITDLVKLSRGSERTFAGWRRRPWGV
ncbi:MAG: hypothetical protein AAFO62_04525 [Pseudomonadota bacterium]